MPNIEKIVSLKISAYKIKGKDQKSPISHFLPHPPKGALSKISRFLVEELFVVEIASNMCLSVFCVVEIINPFGEMIYF
jgi:hypothetical protein